MKELLYNLLPLLGVLLGGVITYIVTQRQVQANVHIARDAQWHGSLLEWRRIQLEAFRGIQSGLWRVAMLASEAKAETERALKAAQHSDADAFDKAMMTVRPLQKESRELIHQLETDIAILGDESMRGQLDQLRDLGVKLTGAFADTESFYQFHDEFSCHYEQFRKSAAQNVMTIMLAPVPNPSD